MLDIASFHSRLSDLTANVILDHNEKVRSAADTRSAVEEVKETTSMEQGELFSAFEQKSATGDNDKKEQTDRRNEPDAESGQPAKEKEKTIEFKKFFSYDEYKKIFCGNCLAASYWWERNMRMLDE